MRPVETVSEVRREISNTAALGHGGLNALIVVEGFNSVIPIELRRFPSPIGGSSAASSGVEPATSESPVSYAST